MDSSTRAREMSSARTSIIAALFAVVIVLVALIVYSLYQEAERFKARASLDALEYSHEVAIGIDGFLSSTEYMLVTLSTQPAIKSQDANAATPMFTQLLKANPQYANIWATRADGWNYAAGLPPPDGKQIYIGDRQYFQDALRGPKMTIQSIPDNRQHAARFAVVMSYPVRDEMGRINGTVNASFELLPVQEILRRTDLPPGAVISIFDEAGYVIARSEAPEKFVGQNINGTKLWETLQSPQPPTFEGEFVDGMMRLGGRSETSLAPWRVLVGVPSSAIYSQLWDALLRQLIILAIPLVAVAYLATRLGRTAIEKSEALVQRDKAEAEIKRLNEDLECRVIERTAELTAANKELESFSYSISHDLRTPLRSIDGFSLALLEDYADKLDDEGKDYLRRVRAASTRAAQLMDDLSRLSCLPRHEMHREPVNLSMLAEKVVDELKAMQPVRRVTFTLQRDIIANSDARLLQVVLESLLGNAWKFTSKLENAEIEFGTVAKDSKLTYFVRDNGAGFDMAFADKLFGTFQRLHSDDEFPGNGIGLATVQRIINRHGGQVWAEGAVDKGATFYFTLGG